MQRIKGKRIGITGGSGNIGSNIAKALEKDNYVRIIDVVEPSQEAGLKKIDFFKCNIADENQCMNALKDIEVLFHEAALTNGCVSMTKPHEYFDINVMGTINLLEASVKNNIEKLIFASTCSVFGKDANSPIGEDQNPNPLSYYGVTKLICEKYINAYHKKFAIPSIILRYFRVHTPTAVDVIGLFIRKLLKGENLTIFGDGKITFDVVNVEDVVQANLLSLSEDIDFDIFHIGSGTGMNLNEISHTIAENLNLELSDQQIDYKPIDFNGRDDNANYDPEIQIADIDKAKKVLGYSPRFSVEQTIQSTIEFLKSN
jgi:nucleoside-diphosphate-sugar epimerase